MTKNKTKHVQVRIKIDKIAAKNTTFLVLKVDWGTPLKNKQKNKHFNILVFQRYNMSVHLSAEQI